jgi:signal transduction histidine kinase
MIVVALGGTAWIQARQAYIQAAGEAVRAGGRTANAVARQLELLRGEYDRALARAVTEPGLVDGERPEVIAAFISGPDGRAVRGWREVPVRASATTPGRFQEDAAGTGPEEETTYEAIPAGTDLSAWAPPGGWGAALPSWRTARGATRPVLVRATALPDGRTAGVVIDLEALQRLVAATVPGDPHRVTVTDDRGTIVLQGPDVAPPMRTARSADVVARAEGPVGTWTVQVSTPRWALLERSEAALRRALPLMAALMLVLGALGAGLAALIARELGRVELATRDLVRQSLDGREPGPTPHSGLSEFQALFQTLGVVGRSLGRAIRNQRAREAELAMANAQLTTTIEELRGVDHSRSEVLHAIGHDIKIPLTAVIGYAELLEDDMEARLNDQQRTFVRGIAENADRVVRLLEDLLDLARMEVGRFAIEPGPIDVAEFLEHTKRHLRPLAERKGVSLVVEPGRALGPGWADPGRLDQILTNLVSNAIKFTPAGGRIRLRAHRAPDKASIVVEVVDTGPGIPADALSKLFQRFYRVEGTTAPGTGLGLAISRKLVEAMGGTIGVLSEVGRGSTFWFTIPVREALPPRVDIERSGAGVAERAAGPEA